MEAPPRRFTTLPRHGWYNLCLINMLVEKGVPFDYKGFAGEDANLQLEAKEESTMAFELLKFINSQIEEQSSGLEAHHFQLKKEAEIED
ncbi:hypothetical protein Tco_0625947 [Tanacetum coccineum]|uniref:Uncharacterized protein n=1 Tax=Tanacetum coccineum TaxID=301880 RepID=A0ABQ4WI95_9ASTR